MEEAKRKPLSPGAALKSVSSSLVRRMRSSKVTLYWLENFSFFAARRFSGPYSTTASDVNRGDLRRVGSEDHGALQDVG